ncbi:hypothetical protein AVEN_4834-1 [Araneus ventricosus]|uniref:Uncharacterized protein n=1 Tax=Araneus ventricosus TaxID=182803 RepID=A0A4Y2Q540_ARAVE|nr:hypothetical protein AVEN_4834-1 [Araneus ventricosus]
MSTDNPQTDNPLTDNREFTVYFILNSLCRLLFQHKLFMRESIPSVDSITHKPAGDSEIRIRILLQYVLSSLEKCPICPPSQRLISKPHELGGNSHVLGGPRSSENEDLSCCGKEKKEADFDRRSSLDRIPIIASLFECWIFGSVFRSNWVPCGQLCR